MRSNSDLQAGASPFNGVPVPSGKRTMPKTFIGDVANFPAGLRPLIEQPHWVTWRWTRKNGKWTKPPYRADDPAQHASTNDPQTWNCFSNAVKAVTGGHADGIGFALTNSG